MCHFGRVGWVGGRGGLDGLVGEWVTRRSRCTCDVVVVWVVLAFDCGLTGVMGLAILCWGLVESGGWLVSIVSVGWCGCGFRSMRVCRW